MLKQEKTSVFLSLDRGECHCSFPQRIQFHAAKMGWADRDCVGPSSYNLAANLLFLVVGLENLNPGLITHFVKEVIQSMDPEGGEIPLESINDWVQDYGVH